MKGLVQIQYTEATHLDGLSNLGFVDDYLRIQGNQKLKNVNGLQGLRHVKQLNINTNNVAKLDGLQGLKTVDEIVYLYSNKALESIAGLKPSNESHR